MVENEARLKRIGDAIQRNTGDNTTVHNFLMDQSRSFLREIYGDRYYFKSFARKVPCITEHLSCWYPTSGDDAQFDLEQFLASDSEPDNDE